MKRIVLLCALIVGCTAQPKADPAVLALADLRQDIAAKDAKIATEIAHAHEHASAAEAKAAEALEKQAAEEQIRQRAREAEPPIPDPPLQSHFKPEPQPMPVPQRPVMPMVAMPRAARWDANYTGAKVFVASEDYERENGACFPCRQLKARVLASKKWTVGTEEQVLAGEGPFQFVIVEINEKMPGGTPQIHYMVNGIVRDIKVGFTPSDDDVYVRHPLALQPSVDPTNTSKSKYARKALSPEAAREIQQSQQPRTQAPVLERLLPDAPPVIQKMMSAPDAREDLVPVTHRINGTVIYFTRSSIGPGEVTSKSGPFPGGYYILDTTANPRGVKAYPVKTVSAPEVINWPERLEYERMARPPAITESPIRILSPPAYEVTPQSMYSIPTPVSQYSMPSMQYGPQMPPMMGAPSRLGIPSAAYNYRGPIWSAAGGSVRRHMKSPPHNYPASVVDSMSTAELNRLHSAEHQRHANRTGYSGPYMPGMSGPFYGSLKGQGGYSAGYAAAPRYAAPRYAARPAYRAPSFFGMRFGGGGNCPGGRCP